MFAELHSAAGSREENGIKSLATRRASSSPLLTGSGTLGQRFNFSGSRFAHW